MSMSKVLCRSVDFNIDALCNEVNRKLTSRKLMKDYQLVVTEPTHLDGWLLDHAYLLKFMHFMHSFILREQQFQ